MDGSIASEIAKYIENDGSLGENWSFMDKQSAIELSVVVLCYQEGRRIRNFLPCIVALLEKNVNSWEVILVGNYIEGFADETPLVVQDLASKDSRLVAVTLVKQGMMGWDARSGLDRAKGRFICLIDGDEQMPWNDIIRIFEKIKTEKLDFVLTRREKRNDGFHRWLNSRTFNLLTRILFPGIQVQDINSKPKIFTREALQCMALASDDWFLDTEMIIQSWRLGLRIGEVPTKFLKGRYRKSFVRPSAILEFLRNLIKARMSGFKGPEAK